MPTNIFIKNIADQNLTFNVDLDTCKVKDLMQMYATKSGVDLNQIMFVYAGKPLRDKEEQLLKELGIQALSTVHAVLRLLGGALVDLTISTINSS